MMELCVKTGDHASYSNKEKMFHYGRSLLLGGPFGPLNPDLICSTVLLTSDRGLKDLGYDGPGLPDFNGPGFDMELVNK